MKRQIKKKEQDSDELQYAKGIADLLDLHAKELDKGYEEMEVAFKKLGERQLSDKDRKEVDAAMRGMLWRTGKYIKDIGGRK
jgi:hypothetical protein